MNLNDLNRHLFDQLDRLAKAENKEEVNKEISRANAIGGIARGVIDSSRVLLDAHKLAVEYPHATKPMPKMLKNEEVH
jgi:hypothetical protein